MFLPGGPSGLHTIITRAYLDLQTFSFLTRPTLSAIQSAALAIESSICYALLHEPLYLNGTSAGAANWSALRVRPVAFEVPDLTEKTDEELEVSEGLHGMLHFTAEQIFPSHLSASAELAPLKDVAEILARKNDWPLLYDTEQLKKNVSVHLYYWSSTLGLCNLRTTAHRALPLSLFPCFGWVLVKVRLP